MYKTQQAEQLRLAADILETGHPWDFQSSREWHQMERANPLWSIANGCKIRLALATPPDGRALHNPDSLTAEQVGAGWRLTLADENLDRNYEYWHKTERRWYSSVFYDETVTYRLPLSVPWPEPQPDPYAELKEAHAAGKMIQVRPKVRTKDWHDEWQDCIPTWGDDYEYRIKPTPTFQLPPPPPGMQWHREDGWKAGDLPQGWRPLVEGEKIEEGDEYHNGAGWYKARRGMAYGIGVPIGPSAVPFRTSRPLTFEHAGKQWTWHRPGDPMPCDGERMVHVLISDDLADDPPLQARQIEWNREDAGDVIGWRYADADEKKTVPLEPEDVPPGSVFRSKDQPATQFWTVTQVWDGGFYLVYHRQSCRARGNNVEWNVAMQRMEINRSIPLTGKWDASAWEPCSKPA